MADKIYKGDYGHTILLNCGTAITGATGCQIKVRKPSNATVSWASTIYGTDYLTYTVTSTDLDEAGIFWLQASLSLGGWVGRGESVQMHVYNEFE